MLDYQFLGLVAVVIAIVTRGSVLPVVVVTIFSGVAILACDAAAKWHRRRHPKPPPRTSPGASTASSGELKRWMTAVERILGSAD
jgi:hypothetical protein